MTHLTKHVRYRRTVFFIFLIGILAGAVLKSLVLDPVSILYPDNTVISLNAVGETVSRQTDGKQVFVCAYRIPEDAPTGLTLAVESYTNPVQVLLDGREIFSYQDPHREKGFNIQWVLLPEESGGKELSVQWSLDTRETVEPELYLGSQNSLYLYYLRENGLSALFGGFFLLLGLGLGISAFFMYRRENYNSRKICFHLGAFVLLTGVWTATDSQILQLLTGRTAGITLLSFLSFTLIPYFFLRFFQDILGEERKELTILCRLLLFNAGWVSLCYLLRIAELYLTLIGTHVLLFASAAVILKFSVSEYRRWRKPEMKKLLTGIVLLLACALWALVSFYIELLDNQYSLYFNIGMMLFVLCLVRAFLDYTYRQIKETADLEAYKKIAFTDLMTGMGNRSAFMTDVRALPPGKRYICLMLDVNDLKLVNDTLGHGAGDELIIDAARCILDSFSPEGKCYRIGGDEFAVVLEEAREENFLGKMEGLQRLIQEKNRNRTPELHLAYGYADSEESGELSVMELFEKADQRMYQKKKRMKKVRDPI